MKAIFDRLFQDEFVIDEKPCPIAARTGNGGGRAEVDEAALEREDLYTLLSNLLKKHEELDGLNRQLRSRGQDGDELEPLVVKLLPFFDSFDRVLFRARSSRATEEIANWLKSVEGLYYRIAEVLESVGLVSLKTVGHSVNLDLHEVVEVKYTKEYPSNTIISERRKGYVFRGKLLRCAQVVVASGDESAGTPER